MGITKVKVLLAATECDTSAPMVVTALSAPQVVAELQQTIMLVMERSKGELTHSQYETSSQMLLA